MHRDNQLVRYIFYISKRNVWTLYICCTNREIACEDIGDGFKSASPWDCNEIIDFAYGFNEFRQCFSTAKYVQRRVPRSSLMHRLISERVKFQLLERWTLTSARFYFATFWNVKYWNRYIYISIGVSKCRILMLESFKMQSLWSNNTV